MSQPRPTDPIGSIGWTERTGGVLTARECLTLARPLVRGELSIVAGRLAMLLRVHSGRRRSIDPASLMRPDSSLARDAEVAAQDVLTPALLNHSSRATRGARHESLCPDLAWRASSVAGLLSLAIGISVGYAALESGFQDAVGIVFQLVVLAFAVGVFVAGARRNEQASSA